MNKLIKNGIIVTEMGKFNGDILIKGGKISSIGNHIDEVGTEIINASGCYVIPGGIDVHTHFDLQAGDHRVVDDYYTGSIAAACGGTTTIVDHIAFGPKECSLHHQINEYHKLSENKSAIEIGRAHV